MVIGGNVIPEHVIIQDSNAVAAERRQPNLAGMYPCGTFDWIRSMEAALTSRGLDGSLFLCRYKFSG